MSYIRICILAVAAIALSACGVTGGSKQREVYKRETFALDSPFQKSSPVSVEAACESARRALLGQGYIIGSAERATLAAKKAFKTADDQTTFLEMNIVCVADAGGSTIFANAVQTVYQVKKSAQSASVGVSAVGSISLPLTGSTDSMVKVADETINDKSFYQRFFAVVDYYLAQVPAQSAAAEDSVPPAELVMPIAPAVLPESSAIATPAVMPEPTPEPQPLPALPVVADPSAPVPAPDASTTPEGTVFAPVLAPEPAPATAPAMPSDAALPPAASDTGVAQPAPAAVTTDASAPAAPPAAPAAGQSAPAPALAPEQTVQPPPASTSETSSATSPASPADNPAAP